MADTTKTVSKEDKKKLLEQTLLQLDKRYGKGAVMKLNEQQQQPMEVVSTGSLALDVALGTGGLPKGRVIEIFGPESSGKTTLTLHIIAEVQKLGGTAAFIDAEHALDPSYAKKIGVNIDDLLIAQPDSGEQALEITESLVQSGAVDIIVVDSVAALVPKAEIDGDMGDSHMGLHARLMSQALRKLTGAVHKTNTILIFINQIRMKIGVVFGSPETTTGGNALKFYASIRLDIRRIETITKSEVSTGNRVRVKVAKNKMAPPFKKAEFDIMFADGISREGCIVEEAVNLDLIKKSGTWFSIGEIKLGQGQENARQYLKENPDIANTLENKIREHYKLGALIPISKTAANVKLPEPKATSTNNVAVSDDNDITGE